MIKNIMGYVVILLLGIKAVWAFDFSTTQNKIPVEIDADNGIVCEQEHNTCTAKGHVKVTHGSTILNTDQLVAFFKKKEDAAQSQQLIRLEASGHVILSSQEKKQHGLADHAVYDIETGEAHFTGKNLHLQFDETIITAQDYLHYSEKTQEATAHGQATAVKGDHTLQADELKAVLHKDEKEQLVVKRIIARGQVTITTPQEIVRGDYGEYDHQTQLVCVENNVRISHRGAKGGLQLAGGFAEVNLLTGQSRLLATKPGGTTGKKVKVLLIPNP